MSFSFLTMFSTKNYQRFLTRFLTKISAIYVHFFLKHEFEHQLEKKPSIECVIDCVIPQQPPEKFVIIITLIIDNLLLPHQQPTTMSKHLNNITARIEASKIRLAKVRNRRNPLPSNDDASDVSSAATNVEEIYADVPTTPFKSDLVIRPYPIGYERFLNASTKGFDPLLVIIRLAQSIYCASCTSVVSKYGA